MCAEVVCDFIAGYRFPNLEIGLYHRCVPFEFPNFLDKFLTGQRATVLFMVRLIQSLPRVRSWEHCSLRQKENAIQQAIFASMVCLGIILECFLESLDFNQFQNQKLRIVFFGLRIVKEALQLTASRLCYFAI